MEIKLKENSNRTFLDLAILGNRVQITDFLLKLLIDVPCGKSPDEIRGAPLTIKQIIIGNSHDNLPIVFIQPITQARIKRVVIIHCHPYVRKNF